MKISRLFASLLLAALVLASAAPMHADAPTQINYQGKLTTSGGATAPNGNYNMRFYLYDSLNGGSLLWQEPANGQPARVVAVTGGVFNVNLGSIVPLELPDFAGSVYLQTEVNGSLQTPRVQLVSTPFALRAATIDSPLSLTDIVNTSLFGTFPGAIVRGQNNGSGGTLQGPGVGVLGINYESNYGYLGGTYGAYGKHDATANYGYLGGSTAGAYGRNENSNAYGYLGYNADGINAKAGTGGRAAYLDGNVTVTGTLTVNGTISLPNVNYIKPDAIGIIRGSDGAKINGVGFSSSSFDSGINTYQIDYPGYSTNSYVTQVTPIGFTNYTGVASSTSVGLLSITIYNAAGSKSKCDFSFVTYRL